MPPVLRPTRSLALAALASATLAAGSLTVTGPASAEIPPESFYPRWCGEFEAPCIVSARLNGGTVTETDPSWSIETTGALSEGTDDYFQFQLNPVGDLLPRTDDDWSITFDTGTLVPRSTEGFAGRPVVERTTDVDGHRNLTYSAAPVVTTTGCEDGGAWPPSCQETATSWAIGLSGEVHDKSDLGNGYDRSQNIDEVSGIFVEKAGDGSPMLTTDMANSHQYDDDGTMRTFRGQARFRLPYSFLRSDLGIPDPDTLVPGSLVGSVRKPNGAPAPATFSVMQDPAGGGIYVDVSRVTFSVKQLRVRRGTITPTKPTQVSATRTGPGRGFVDFEPSKARGADVTGYAGRCVSGKQVLTATSDNIVRFTGLRAGRAYDCQVRARSEAGAGPWSQKVRMGRTPIDPG